MSLPGRQMTAEREVNGARRKERVPLGRRDMSLRRQKRNWQRLPHWAEAVRARAAQKSAKVIIRDAIVSCVVVAIVASDGKMEAG